MKFEEQHKDAFLVVGLKIHTSNTKESNPESALIPGLWQQFFSENIESQIPNKSEDTSILGVYWNYEGDSEKSYCLLVGREVANLQTIPKELVGIEVPESDYLVFSAEGEMPNVIYSLWESIRQYFSENNLHQRKYGYDYECYRADNSSRVDIYVSVKS